MSATINTIIDFKHKTSAHCENGATANLMTYAGIPITEPLVFGIGSGIFFAYMPFMKLNGLNVISFRSYPGTIFNNVTKRLGLKAKRTKFSDPRKSMEALDALLEKGQPVGMLVGVYNLPYFPPEYRFHFNAHNIVAFGKKDNQYIVSDSVMENVETISHDDLMKVRFAMGTHPPKGRMYYIEKPETTPDLKKAISKGIRETCSRMLHIPIPLFGVNGITYLGKRMQNWPKKYGAKKASLMLGQTIRMLEEIGTGGAGFRFMYAAFLQEASAILDKPELLQLSKDMTNAGDQWRVFSAAAAKHLRTKNTDPSVYIDLGNLIIAIAEREKQIFLQLEKLVK